jgi:hypothetical protein
MAKYSGKKTSLLFAENITKTLAIYKWIERSIRTMFSKLSMVFLRLEEVD